jgi:GNAT superfamily N-acetyltransferase
MRPARSDLLELAREPWLLRRRNQPLLVRPSEIRDLAAVAHLHSRCSARALLDRYRRGGRQPAVASLDRMLRDPATQVVVAPDGSIIAIGTAARDPLHRPHCAEVGVLVDDSWYRSGIGTALMRHLAGTAHAAGYQELIAYPGTRPDAAQRLMIDVGRTRMVPDPEDHLHTYLHESCTLGLGAVRQRLAG